MTQAKVEASVATARAARLRYVSDEQPGIRRIRAGKGFRYIGPDGEPITDDDTRRRIRALAIPPAYTDVWICPDPRGHIQATGRDSRGRKQYRYHARWQATRDEAKYDRMQAFAAALPGIRKRAADDLNKPGLPREKVLATVVRLLEMTAIRIGNDEYARTNKSYGLTTLRDRHARVKGDRIRVRFRGKHGKQHAVDLKDRRLAKVVKRCQDLPGQELFQYIDDNGVRQDVKADDVNTYLREISGQDFTAKDFRTWAGTVLCAVALNDLGPVAGRRRAKKNIVQAIKLVAERLGNTPAVCRKAYVHPAVVAAYMDGCTLANLTQQLKHELQRDGQALDRDERAVLKLLDAHAQQTSDA